jgi:hypothetical protein
MSTIICTKAPEGRTILAIVANNANVLKLLGRELIKRAAITLLTRAGQLVIARRDSPTLFDLIEKSLDQISGAIKVRAEADRFSLRLHRGGTLAQEPLSVAKALIQSASYPLSASSIDPDFRRDKRLKASRLS